MEEPHTQKMRSIRLSHLAQPLPRSTEMHVLGMRNIVYPIKPFGPVLVIDPTLGNRVWADATEACFTSVKRTFSIIDCKNKV